MTYVINSQPQSNTNHQFFHHINSEKVVDIILITQRLTIKVIIPFPVTRKQTEQLITSPTRISVFISADKAVKRSRKRNGCEVTKPLFNLGAACRIFCIQLLALLYSLFNFPVHLCVAG